jgi:frataxin-like iron-binding protein CyaY
MESLMVITVGLFRIQMSALLSACEVTFDTQEKVINKKSPTCEIWAILQTQGGSPFVSVLR